MRPFLVFELHIFLWALVTDIMSLTPGAPASLYDELECVYSELAENGRAYRRLSIAEASADAAQATEARAKQIALFKRRQDRVDALSACPSRRDPWVGKSAVELASLFKFTNAVLDAPSPASQPSGDLKCDRCNSFSASTKMRLLIENPAGIDHPASPHMLCNNCHDIFSSGKLQNEESDRCYFCSVAFARDPLSGALPVARRIKVRYYSSPLTKLVHGRCADTATEMIHCVRCKEFHASTFAERFLYVPEGGKACEYCRAECVACGLQLDSSDMKFRVERGRVSNTTLSPGDNGISLGGREEALSLALHQACMSCKEIPAGRTLWAATQHEQDILHQVHLALNPPAPAAVAAKGLDMTLKLFEVLRAYTGYGAY